MTAQSSFVATGLHFAHRNGVAALQGVDLDVPVGTIVGLVGDNGAGKTTLLSILARHQRCRRGRLTGPNGTHWDSLRIGWMASDSFALPDVAVEAFLATTLGPTLGLGVETSRERVQALARGLGLQDELMARPSRLSRGQRVRCAMLAAFLESPDLILLDEPSLGLDPSATDRACEVVRRERTDHGTTLLISDHRLDVLQDLCDAWVFLVEGRVAATISRDDVRDQVDLAERYRQINLPSS